MKDILTLDVEQLLARFEHRTLSPVELLRAVLNRMTQIDSLVNAVCALDEDRALTAARESERRWRRASPRGPLDGIPVSVKDLVDVAGMPTRYGSMTTSERAADADAPAVARLRGAGAILFGKTTTSEFGNKIVTDSLQTGATRNPWDIRLSSGGSSGGSAVAVALGMGPLSLATDGGGSIRIPACWSGLFGLKPSFGLVPVGPTATWPALSTLGPLARSARDAARMLNAMTHECEARSPYAARLDYRAELEKGLSGLRIAYCPTPAGASIDPEIDACVRQAVEILKVRGACICERDVAPLSKYYGDGRMHSIQWQVFFAQHVRRMDVDKRALLDPELQALADAGERVSAATFADALLARHALSAAMETFFDRFDLLLTPTFHRGPPPVPGLPADMRMAPVLTAWCNQTGSPAASVPCGFAAGMPTGLQIIGRRGADALVLRAAHAYELARGPFPLPQMHRMSESAEPRP